MKKTYLPTHTFMALFIVDSGKMTGNERRQSWGMRFQGAPVIYVNVHLNNL